MDTCLIRTPSCRKKTIKELEPYFKLYFEKFYPESPTVKEYLKNDVTIK